MPPYSNLILNGTVLPISDSLVILGVHLDSKHIFEHHIRSVVSSVARFMGRVRRACKIFGITGVIATYLGSYVLKDSVVKVSCNLDPRRRVSAFECRTKYLQ